MNDNYYNMIEGEIGGETDDKALNNAFVEVKQILTQKKKRLEDRIKEENRIKISKLEEEIAKIKIGETRQLEELGAQIRKEEANIYLLLKDEIAIRKIVESVKKK